MVLINLFKRLKRRHTYLSYYSVAVVVTLFIVGCSATKNAIVTEKVPLNVTYFIDSLRTDSLKYTTLQVEKFNFRIDYRGELRTFKSSFYHIVDSVIFLNVSSTFAFSTASFYFYPNRILAVDKPNKQISLISYELLKKKLGFNITFGTVQSILFAQSEFLAKSPEFTLNNEANKNYYVINVKQKIDNSDSLLFYDYSYRLADKRLEYFDITKENGERLLEAQYNYSKNHTSLVPLSVLVSFIFDKIPVEVELEFKEPDFNSIISVEVDSTFSVIPLDDKNE